MISSTENILNFNVLMEHVRPSPSGSNIVQLYSILMKCRQRLNFYKFDFHFCCY